VRILYFDFLAHRRDSDCTTLYRVQLKFIQPHGPHFGGLWEAALKSIKFLLQRTQVSQFPTYEELCTLLAEIEVCLNSRYLCAFTHDPLNPTYLSPGKFLIGEPLTQLPAVYFTNVVAIDVPGGKPTINNCRSSATFVIRLPPDSATASTLAEDIP